MKKLNLFVTAMTAFLWLFTACNNTNSIKKPEQPKAQKTNGIVKAETVDKNQKATPTDVKTVLLKAFGLNDKQCKITASAAASKIKEKKGKADIAGFSFDECTVTAYDDKKGTFTVEARGTTGSNRSFTKSFTYTGFAHPYDSYLQSTQGSLNFEDAIKNNWSVKKLVKELAANTSVKTNTLENISFILQNNKNVSIGKHDKEGYELEILIQENTGADKAGKPLKIKPVYNVVYKKATDRNAVTQTSENKTGRFLQGNNYTYFTERDVCRHLADKVTEMSFHVDSTAYASFYYAYAVKSIAKSLPKELYKTPSEIADTIKKYTAIKTEDTHLMIEGLVLNFLKNSTPVADDKCGTLTFTAAVGSAANIQHGTGDLATKEITLKGFKTIKSTQDFNTCFSFTVIKQANKSLQEAKQSYLKEDVIETAFYNPDIKDPFERNPWKQNSKRRAFYLDVSANEYDETYKTLTTINGKKVFIERIFIKKKQDSDMFELSVLLKSNDSEPLRVPIHPVNLLNQSY